MDYSWLAVFENVELHGGNKEEHKVTCQNSIGVFDKRLKARAIIVYDSLKSHEWFERVSWQGFFIRKNVEALLKFLSW